MGVMKRLYEEKMFGRGETAQERHEKKWAKYRPKPKQAPKQGKPGGKRPAG